MARRRFGASCLQRQISHLDEVETQPRGKPSNVGVHSIYTHALTRGVRHSLLSLAHTHTERASCAVRICKRCFPCCHYTAGPFKDQKQRVRICKLSPGTMAKLHFAWLSIKFALALKRRDFVLHTDNAASGINYGPFNCLNS